MLWDYSGPVPVQDTLTLLSRRPWYSREYNDVVSALALQPWGMTDITSFLAGHQVGLKQYELTNHLGNVQATVSDYPYLRSVGEGDTIKLRNPALASAYDYYPFGMLMPDRYVSDTTSKCITISQPQWISSWTNNIYSAASWVWPGYTPMTGGGTTPASSASVSGGTVNLVLSNGTTAPAMLDFHFSVAPVTPQQIVLDVASTMPQIGISVMQQVNGQWVNLAATTAQAGLNTLTFTPAAAQVKLRFYRMDAAYTSKTMSIKTVNLQKRLLSQQTVLVDVCDEVNDKYRFGFNGQEKVNEWAGIGNFMDFGARGYDSRVGRWLSIDPLFKIQPGWSTYKSFYDNPNVYSDDRGQTEYNKIVFKANGKEIGSAIKVVNEDKLAKFKIWGTDWTDRSSREYTYGFYDIIHTTTIEINKDGKQVEKKSTQYSLRYTRHPLMTWFPELDPDGWQGRGGFQKGGTYYTTKTSGGSDPTKYKSLSPTKREEVGEFLDAMSVIARGQGVKGDLGLQNSFSDWMSTGASATDNVKSSSDYFKEDHKKNEEKKQKKDIDSVDQTPKVIYDTASFPYRGG